MKRRFNRYQLGSARTTSDNAAFVTTSLYLPRPNQVFCASRTRCLLHCALQELPLLTNPDDSAWDSVSRRLTKRTRKRSSLVTSHNFGFTIKVQTRENQHYFSLSQRVETLSGPNIQTQAAPNSFQTRHCQKTNPV